MATKKCVLYRNSILAQDDDLKPERVDYVRKILEKTFVPKDKHSKILIMVVSYELGDEVVDVEVRPIVVAMLVKQLCKKLMINRVGPEDVERVVIFLGTSEGKLWLDSWFKPFKPEEIQTKAPTTTLDDKEDRQPSSDSIPGTNNIMSPTAIQVGVKSSTSAPPSPQATLTAAKTGHRRKSGTHKRKASNILIDNIICPNCHGQICGRGLTCHTVPSPTSDGPTAVDTVVGNDIQVGDVVMNGPAGWKVDLLFQIAQFALLILSGWMAESASKSARN